MVASSNAYSTEAALEILQQGGNAVDAALAATLAAMVVEPNMTALGGFGSLVFYEAQSGRSRLLTFWMQYPENFAPDAKAGLGAFVIAPGAPRGLSEASSRHGKLPFKSIVAPAVRLAREGFPVYGTLYGQMFERYGFLTATAEGREAWTAGGFLPTPGSTFRQPVLADTLAHYGDAGPEYFYQGPFAEKLIETVSRHGGNLTLQDLADYRVIESEPLPSTYRDYKIVSTWPPDSGGLGLALGLNILQELNLREAGHYSGSVVSAYYVYSTLRTVSDLTGRYVRDPEVYGVPAETLLSSDFAIHQAQRIRYEKTLAESSRPHAAKPTTTTPELEGDSPPELSTGTVHVSVIDAEGNGCGITSSIAGDTFGQSGLVVDGVLINGSGRFRPPGRQDRRWSSAAAPSLILRDGSLVAVVGSPSDIYSTMLQVIVNLLDFDMDAQQAVSAPRMYSRRSSQRESAADYLLETRFGEGVLEGLKALNAEVDYGGTYANLAGAARVVFRDRRTGELQGGVDPRRPGLARGY